MREKHLQLNFFHAIVLVLIQISDSQSGPGGPPEVQRPSATQRGSILVEELVVPLLSLLITSFIFDTGLITS